MYIRVRVNTGSKREELEVLEPDLLRISVKEKAERNLANKRVINILASHFNIPLGKVRLIAGHHYSSKIFEIPD